MREQRLGGFEVRRQVPNFPFGTGPVTDPRARRCVRPLFKRRGARTTFGGCRYCATLKPTDFPDRVMPSRLLNRFEMLSAPLSSGASG